MSETKSIRYKIISGESIYDIFHGQLTIVKKRAIDESFEKELARGLLRGFVYASFSCE